MGYNYAPEPTGIGKYSGEMIEWLARHGYDCTVLTAYPYYPHWKVQEPYVKSRFWYKKETQYFDGGGRIRVYRCPMYVPASPTGLKRILLDLSFILSSFLKLIQLLPGHKFDYILSIVPSFLLGLPCIMYKKIKGAKLFYHIHDMQIEAARDLKMIKSPQLINTLFNVEKFIFKQCDEITCVGDGMVRKTQEKIVKRVSLFPNWANLRDFYPIANRGQLKSNFGFNPSDKIILYSGAIGEKQGLEVILHAAKSLQIIRNMKFLICGSGPYKNKLQEMADEMKLKNVIFCPLQPVEKFNFFLNIADIHLVVQKASACDLVMPSKLTTILSIGGLAIVTANKDSSLHAVVDKHKIGILTEAENHYALIEGIVKSVSNNNNYIRSNARKYAERNLSIDRIMGAFAHKLEAAVTVPIKRVDAFEDDKKTAPFTSQEPLFPLKDFSWKKTKESRPFYSKDRPLFSLSKNEQKQASGQTDSSDAPQNDTKNKRSGKPGSGNS